LCRRGEIPEGHFLIVVMLLNLSFPFLIILYSAI
jgi:hypothetical protein